HRHSRKFVRGRYVCTNSGASPRLENRVLRRNCLPQRLVNGRADAGSRQTFRKNRLWPILIKAGTRGKVIFMNVIDTLLAGVKIIEPKVFGDHRGFFKETFSAERYAQMAGISQTFVQDNHSRSRKGVLRGL